MVDCIDSEGFRANVGIVLMRGDGQLFLGGRTGGRGWQFPQGGVRPGEPLLDALYRELHEEVGLEPADVEVVAQTRDWLRYRLPPRYVRKTSLPLCVGQKQRWFLLRFKSSESRLRFDATGEPPEFDRWRWVEYWDPIREVVYFKRQVYRRALHELGRRVITRFVEDVIRASGDALVISGVQSAADVRAHRGTLVGFSAAMAEADRATKRYLFANLYRHPRVMKIRGDAAGVVDRLFRTLLEKPDLLPDGWAEAAKAAWSPSDEAKRARIVCDYIAGMTDRFALAEHRRLFGTAPELTAAFGPHGRRE